MNITKEYKTEFTTEELIAINRFEMDQRAFAGPRPISQTRHWANAQALVLSYGKLVAFSINDCVTEAELASVQLAKTLVQPQARQIIL